MCPEACGTSHRLVYGQRGTARLGKRAKGDPTPGEPPLEVERRLRGGRGDGKWTQGKENTFK